METVEKCKGRHNKLWTTTHQVTVRKRSKEECVYLCDQGWVWRC